MNDLDGEVRLRLEYDLQFFAKDGPGGEKTEVPTAKKLNDARKEGQVAKSKEIITALMLLALFVDINNSLILENSINFILAIWVSR